MVSDSPRLLVVDRGQPLPEGVRTLIDTMPCRVTAVHDLDEAKSETLLDEIDAVVITHAPADAAQRRRDPELRTLLAALDEKHISTLLLGDDVDDSETSETGLCRMVPNDATAEELWGRLKTLVSLRPWVSHMEAELAHLQRLGTELNRHLSDLDQEMRLASRLQRDFLPRELPSLGPARFAVLFRPASGVSGDIYDVFKIDDRRIGFYVADAVGHGIAASLLTMFVKHALVTQRLSPQNGAAACPSANIAAINDALTAQELPNCQFVTACYCVLDVESLTLTVARGGHPYPIHIGRDGRLREIQSAGPLLGVLTDEEFPTTTIQLEPGDKVVLFSDGVELSFVREREPNSGAPVYEQQFHALAGLSAAEMVEQLGNTIDSEEGSLRPRDDVTVVVAEIEG